MALVTFRAQVQSAKFPQVVAAPQSLLYKLVIYPLASCRPQSRHQVQTLRDRVYIPVLFNCKGQCSPSLTDEEKSALPFNCLGLGIVGLPEPLTKSASGFPRSLPLDSHHLHILDCLILSYNSFILFFHSLFFVFHFE